MQLKWLSSTPYRTSQSKAGTNLPNKFFWGLPSKDHIIRGGSLCIWSLMSAIQMMDRNDLLIPADQAAEIETLLIQHLLHYQGIWQYYNSKGVKRWKIRPKHHDLEHIAKITKKTLIRIFLRTGQESGNEVPFFHCPFEGVPTYHSKFECALEKLTSSTRLLKKCDMALDAMARNRCNKLVMSHVFFWQSQKRGF